VKALLDREAPGEYEIVTHSILRLHRQSCSISPTSTARTPRTCS
jgi:hypothetical protein